MKDVKEIPALYLALIAVVVVGVVGFLGYRALSGPSYPAIPKMTDTYKSIDDMARRSQGDFSKLTAEEQSNLNSFARGRGKEYLANRYKIITTGGK